MTDIFGGEGQGQALFTYFPIANYVLWMEFFQCDAKEIQKVYQQLFPGIKGKLNATFRIVGDKQSLDLLAIKLRLLGGGLFKPL